MHPNTARRIQHIAADGLEQLYRWRVQDAPDSAEIARNARITAAADGKTKRVPGPKTGCLLRYTHRTLARKALRGSSRPTAVIQ
jgi:hypothetical protein